MLSVGKSDGTPAARQQAKSGQAEQTEGGRFGDADTLPIRVSADEDGLAVDGAFPIRRAAVGQFPYRSLRGAAEGKIHQFVGAGGNHIRLIELASAWNKVDCRSANLLREDQRIG